MSRYKDGHWFHGKVLYVIGDRAIVDDNSGLTALVIPLSRLFEEIQ